MDLASLRDKVSTTGSFPTSDATQIDEWINEALVDFCSRTGLLQDVLSFTLTIDQARYALTTVAADLLRFRGLSISGGDISTPYELEAFPDLSALIDANRRSSESDRPTRFAVMGLSTLVLHPAPSAAFVLGGEYVKSATVLTDDADIPEIPTRYHIALWYKAMSLGLLWDQQEDDSDFNGRYEAEIVRCSSELKRVHGHRPKSLRPASRTTGYSDPLNVRSLTDGY